MDFYSGYDKLKNKTMCLKKYLPKTKSHHDYSYIHYQDPSFQSKFKGAVLKKDYHIYSLFNKRLRDKSSPLPRKVVSQSNSLNQGFISNKNIQLSISANKYFDSVRLNADYSPYSKINNNEGCMNINSNPLTNKYTSTREDPILNIKKYKLNFSLPIIPKIMIAGKEALIKNEYLISKLAFFSK